MRYSQEAISKLVKEHRAGVEVITGVDLQELLTGMDLSRIRMKTSAENGLYQTA